MKILMGFGSFDSTKEKKVAGNEVGAVDIKKTRKFKQYMNRWQRRAPEIE
jgi:U4/U6.U5 tri-snRNP-associated protein 3